MKKSNFHIFLCSILFLAFFACLSACNNLTGSYENQKQKNPNKAYLKINIDDTTLSRTALPSFSRDSIKNFAFTIKGTTQTNPQEGDWETLGTYNDTSASADNLDSLEHASLEVETGEWTFELTAEKDGTKLSAQATATIESGENTINFSLEWDDAALDATKTGSLSFTVDFSQASNAGDITFVTGQLYSYDIQSSTASEITGENASKYQAKEITITSSTATYSLEEIPAGNYRIEILLYVQDTNTDNTSPIQIMAPLHELAIITGGQESSGTRSINNFNELYTIEWHNLDGASAPNTLPLNYSRFSDSYTLPSSGLSKAGYTFGGWYEDSACEGTEVTTLAKGTTGKKDFYAKWNPNTNTPYVVKHWKQKVSGNVNSHNATNYELVNEDATESKTGITDQLVEFELKDTSTTNKTDPFYGFNPPSSSEITAAQALTISGDGSRVVNLYYPRKTVTVMYKDEILHVSPYPKTLATYRYGQTVSVSELPTSKGTVFLGWSLQQSPGDSDTLYNMNTNTYRYVLDSIDTVTFYAQWAYSKINDTYYPSFERTIQAIEALTENSDVSITLYSLATKEQIGRSSYVGCLLNSLAFSSASTINFAIAENADIEFDAGNRETFLCVEKYVSIDLSGLKSVELLSGCFAGCTNLASVTMPKTLDITNLADPSLENMFADCSSLTSIDLSMLDTSNITNMKSMFSNCVSLITIYASNKFVTTSVDSGNDENMFYHCQVLVGGSGTRAVDVAFDKTVAKIDGGQDDPGLFTAKASSNSVTVTFNTMGGSTVASQTLASGSYAARPKTPLKDNFVFDGWYTDTDYNNPFDITATPIVSDITLYAKWELNTHYAKIDGTFYDSYDEAKGVLSTLSAGEEHTVIFYSIPADDLGSTSYPGSMIYGIMQSQATAVHLIIHETANIDLGTNNEATFYNGDKFVSIDLSGVKRANFLGSMFSHCSNLQSVTFADDFDTSYVEDMREMFSGCTMLTEVDLTSFKTNKVKYSAAMFLECSSLTTIYASSSFIIPSSVTSVDMFAGCNSLVGGNGTKYAVAQISNGEYARLDTSSTPGYFSKKPVVGLSCNVGDVILNDGTVIPYVAGSKLSEQQSAAAIAVIFYDGTGSLGDKPLGIGLYQPSSVKPLMLEAAAGYSTNLASDNNSGKVFTQAVYSCSDYNGSLYPAFSWLQQYFKNASGALDSSDYKDDWYLPSKNELLEIYSKMQAINGSLEMINNKNAMGFVTDLPDFAAYQSPAKVNFAGYMSFQTGAWAEDCPKKEEFQIRAIHEF